MTDGPEVVHGTLELPNRNNMNPNAVQAACERQAQTMVAEGERAVDVRWDGGSAKRGNDTIMVHRFSFQKLLPGQGSYGIRAR